MFDLDELRQAQDVVARHMPPTPQYSWPGLCGLAGCEVWLKHENHTPIGAFKVRGGLVLLDELQHGPGLPRKLVTATRGNHGQSIPYAACRLGVPVTVYAPKGNSVEKNAAMTGWGAELIEFGDDFEESRLEAVRVAEEEGAMIVPPFHHALVRGVATYALELFEAVAGLDAVYVPIGMGSGICGVIQVRDLLGLKTEVVGVVAKNAAAMVRSLEAGRVVATESANTFADGMACRVPMEEPLDIVREGAARLVEVSEEEIAEAMRMLYRSTHNVAEGAGAAAFAALMQERERQAGRKIGVILTGGNVDAEVFRSVLGG
ncbi:MAG: threonine dehydratase [Gammaproteobacteria bacterium]|nr:threonine dehydratase [Gammaproteobacteria bacterium]MDE0507136.1 threonine dehydratase [Gammaproteobacteria bacterium]